MKFYNANEIRNIAVFGHGGEGKTTLTEAMLFNAGLVDRFPNNAPTTDSDPEEQKRKIEASQAASNVGTILGLAIGVIKEFTQENESLARTPAEEKSIEEEEDFKEFLTRMDEEYGYEEQLQQTM